MNNAAKDDTTDAIKGVDVLDQFDVVNKRMKSDPVYREAVRAEMRRRKPGLVKAHTGVVSLFGGMHIWAREQTLLTFTQDDREVNIVFPTVGAAVACANGSDRIMLREVAFPRRPKLEWLLRGGFRMGCHMGRVDLWFTTPLDQAMDLMLKLHEKNPKDSKKNPRLWVLEDEAGELDFLGTSAEVEGVG